MITPSDIQAVEFGKEMRGYSQQEVDKFLDDLTVDYEAVLSENASLKKTIEDMTARLEEYKTQEGAVIKTLETAKSLMNDISASAEKRADILLLFLLETLYALGRLSGLKLGVELG
ncbi:MAG: DivIVA domain-containing protein, partial [Firmicutes bacterium]|nr:DivIVA domain-containing protein [Bacillota bacterium]